MGLFDRYRRKNAKVSESIMEAVTYGEVGRGRSMSQAQAEAEARAKQLQDQAAAAGVGITVSIGADVDAFHDDLSKVMDDFNDVMSRAFTGPAASIAPKPPKPPKPPRPPRAPLSALYPGSGTALVRSEDSSFVWQETTTTRVTINGKAVENGYLCVICGQTQPPGEVFLVDGNLACAECHSLAPELFGEKSEQEPLRPAEEIVDDLAKLRDELT